MGLKKRTFRVSRSCATSCSVWPPWALACLREGGLLDVAQVGELLLEVRVALRLDLALVGRLAVSGEDRLRNVQPLRHLADGREALLVEEGVVVIVDEHLR